MSYETPRSSDWEDLLLEDGKAPSADGGAQRIAMYLGALSRRKWLLLICALAGIAVGLALTRFFGARYRAETTLWIEGVQQNMAAVGPILAADRLQTHTWLELLRSNSVLEPVVIERRLYLQPDPNTPPGAFATFRLRPDFRPGAYSLQIDAGGQFVLLDEEDVPLESGRIGDAVGAGLGFEWVPPPGALPVGQRIEFTVNSPREVARQFGDALETRLSQDENFLRVAMVGPDPQNTADVLNAVADRYVEVVAQLKRSRLDETSAVLLEQLTFAEQNLRDAEMELEAFRVETITLPSDQAAPAAQGGQATRDPAFDAYFEMKVEREQLRRDRESIESTLAAIREGQLTVDALGAVPGMDSAVELTAALEERGTTVAEIRTLERRYTDDYLPLRRLRESLEVLEGTTIPQLASGFLNQLRLRETELDSRLGGASAELQEIPPRVIEAARLQRRVTIADNLFTTLKQRYEEARLAAESSIPDVRILDEAAVPYWPLENRRLTLILFGVLGGIGVGVVTALGLDRLDTKLRYPEQIATEFGLTILGALPSVPLRGRFQAERERQLGEAMREIRLNLTRGMTGLPLAVTITSAESGEGKSFVAKNLARSFSTQGVRTLLIDGDIRRGQLHHGLGCSRAPGLTDVLVRCDLAEALQTTSVPGLTFMGSGTRTDAGPELLSTEALPRMLESLKRDFAVIVVDSPPLGAGVDPHHLAMATENVLVVVRTDRTDRRFAAAKLGLLRRVPVRIRGAILNGVPPSAAYTYYSYLPGYGVEAEGAAV